MPKQTLAEMERKMKISVHATGEEFATVRTGRASPGLLDRITVEYYGSHLPVNQVATITVPEPRQLLISPWDKSVSSTIEKAISKSDLGLMPIKDGDVIRINVPQLSEERRKEMVKLVAKKAEQGKIALRNIRRETNEELERKKKDKENPVSEDEIERIEKEVQKVTDKHVAEIDELKDAREQEILAV
ncbi:MAG: ribosome recycling factor [Armatimonadetes bacterium]|nr:ribosome recycling factor [Armatimonadota bacterium]